MSRIPDLPSGFTPEYLTGIFRDRGLLPADGQIASVECSQVGDGTGMMAELSKLSFEFSGSPGTAPASCIAKYASGNPTNREIALSYNLYERETRFAEELDPKTDARAALTYHTDLVGDRFLILMEDLTDYEVGSQVEGATLRQTELAIDELAKLHTAFWNRVDQLDWVPGIGSSYHADNMRSLCEIGVDGIQEKFGDCLHEKLKSSPGDFLAAITEMQGWMMEKPLTLVHGDFRMENLLYGCLPDHDPVVVIDWQGPLLSRGMNDVALFLGQSTKTEVRREHERALIQRYMEGLQQGGVEGLSAGAMWDDYRHAIMYNWVYVVVVAGTLDSSNQTAFDWMYQMVERQTAASEDLNAFDLMPV